jgi:predicted DNA-binding transcriptional regulator YafY
VLETSAKLLRLLGLLQARPEWSGADLAERLGVTVRTLRRDVQRLRDLDYPVHSVPGVAGGYRLGSGRALPPLLLDDDEAIAVVVSLRSAASHTVAGLSDASVSALAKLEQVLPARLRERTAALQHATVALTGPGPVVDPEQLAALAAACRRHQRLRFSYRSRSGSDSSRAVEPHRLVSTGYRWYLLAFDVKRADWRTFRVDRITESAEVGGRFVPREAPDPAAFVARAVTSAPYRYRARVLVHAPARVVAEEFSRTSGVVTDAGADRCLLTTGSDSLGALTFHLAALGVDFTVLEPQELNDFIRTTADRLAQVTQRSEREAGQPSRGPPVG